MKKFANAKKVEERETIEDGDNKKVVKEDGAEEKTEDSSNHEGTFTRMLSIFKKKKHLVEKEKTEDEKTTEDKLEDVKDNSEVQEIVTDLVNGIVEKEEIVEKEDDSEEKTEDSPNNENTLTRMLSNVMKKKKKKH